IEIQNATEMRMTQTDPVTHARFHVDRGRQMLSEGFAAEAEKQFREAVLLDPVNIAAHVGLANSLETSDAKTARAEAMTALHLHPSADIYLTIVLLDLRANNVQAAAEDLDHA